MIFKFRSDRPENAFKKITDYVRGKDDWFVVEIHKAKQKRSLKQNAYYWGVVVSILSDHTGYTSDETHQELARMFLGYENNGKLFVRSTAKLNTVEFEAYMEKCREWANREMSVIIPLPNEVTEEVYMALQNIFNP